MATTIETLKKPNGNHVLPRTRAKAVSMEDGTTVEAAIMDINTILDELPKVTTADNGKVLMVVNGAWAVVDLNLTVDADGVVSV